MIDIEALKGAIEDSGMPINTIAIRSGIKRETLYKKLDNPNSIKVSEAEALSRVLRLNNADRNRIFFAKDAE